MKTTNIKLSLLILISLVLLSYGFLIYAQEDGNNANIFTPTSSNNSAETNLTKELAQKISVVAANPTTDGQQVSADQLKSIVSESLTPSFSENELPAVSQDEIKIKKQNYKGTAEQIKAKKAEDFSNYIVAVYYIFSSSSPKSIANTGDLGSINNYLLQTTTSALSSRNSSALNELSASGQKMLDQLKDVEVPEDLVSIHQRALQLAKYAIKLKPAVDVNSGDPLTDLVNLSKMQGLIGITMDFSTEATAKFAEYGLEYDDSIKDKLKTLGITPPDLTTLSAPTKTSE